MLLITNLKNRARLHFDLCFLEYNLNSLILSSQNEKSQNQTQTIHQKLRIPPLMISGEKPIEEASSVYL